MLRRAKSARSAGVQRTVSPRGRARPARCIVPIWAVCGADERQYDLTTKTQRHQGKIAMDLPLPPSEQEDKIGKAIVNAAYTVHKALGPGLLESIYEVCFCHELTKQGL